MNTIKNELTPDQYYAQVFPKRTIVIHHTAGGPNPINVIHGWQYNPERVATSYVIAGKEDKTESYQEGDVFQAFDDKYWAHHLGTTNANNTQLNQQSIAIEICNWGQLLMKDGKFYNYVNQEVPGDEVCVLGEEHRGFIYYHKYTDKQLESLKELLNALCDKYSIDKTYHPEMFDIVYPALAGKDGIFTHCSYRKDKCDCPPQPNLIEALKCL